ncbi:MAG TPA: phosphoribosylamine--glycine ligase [Actinomycetota bacterium]|nr:phosphoribosylamine--glycine ligase [Actinomycetota bacterium]
MKVLVVGGGGREHALVWGLARSPAVGSVVCAPGNAGIAREAACVPVAADDVPGLLDLVERETVDLTVIGPEAPLVAGLADALEQRGRLVFGPTRAAARLEGSKAWAKALCERHGIPAAGSRTASSMEEALGALDEFEPPYVVKADGLAAGKGVVIAEDRTSAVEALSASLERGAFGAAGERVLVEEFLTGREVSAFALSDGADVVTVGFARDFKRVGDGDAGPNTGGMGAYSPVPFLDRATVERVVDEVLVRAVHAMASEGVRYRGVVYAGLMLTQDGPKVLEFNARFGDPETQVLVPRMEADLAELLLACAQGTLGSRTVEESEAACVTVVLASGGYPGDYSTDLEITGLEEAAAVDDALVFHAGTAERRGRVVTSGGRVLSVSGLGRDLAEARARAYEACSRISFPGMHHRRDIAARAAEEERT